MGLRATMSPLAANLRFTLTWDQGSEMAAHDRIGDLFDEGVFFAHAGKPWQRGSNENTNGLLRQYSPKGPTCASTPPPHSRPSLSASTTDRARHSAGALRPTSSKPD